MTWQFHAKEKSYEKKFCLAKQHQRTEIKYLKEEIKNRNAH